MNDKYKTHAMDEETLQMSKGIREKASELDSVLETVPNSREKSLAITRLEECVMWANKALAMYGVKQ